MSRRAFPYPPFTDDAGDAGDAGLGTPDPITEAYHSGIDEGIRRGFTQSWRWHTVVGAVAGFLIAWGGIGLAGAWLWSQR